jgi:hypothetical protein
MSKLGCEKVSTGLKEMSIMVHRKGCRCDQPICGVCKRSSIDIPCGGQGKGIGDKWISYTCNECSDGKN